MRYIRMNKCIAYSTTRGKEFVENTQDEWPHKWHHKVMYYDVIGECTSLDTKQLKRALTLAMNTWDIEIDISFRPWWWNTDKTITEPNLTVDFKSSLEDKMFKDKPSVLAYAYFPGQGEVSGKIVFNDDYIWSLNGKGISGKKAKEMGKADPRTYDDASIRTYNVIHVLIHELGHSLGLRHDKHNDTEDVMDAFYSGKLDLSKWDISRIRQKYPYKQHSRLWNYAKLKRIITRMKYRL